ncbi:branched-chain amino acid transport system II carrier protein [Streptobacillus moniliformis]|uniref:Branched-chain amino acid transport system II carrier protein n=1 Tax=Streptobacillus moniliformis (strain ATCC 14647 / DSM 12112 / NCTC 10651 / 9901) TaxID=519441 RepID=D1AW26_STRM9|nr:branched-chain amino acid transport system II carrier protein [Streptobacillus moniliformis]ACZ00502.1 branched-chain amino acid transport system II carrier protein [Streptobacillus moniliformis DSM 12112]AVL43079.1 branched-chain amino acid transport system II carrier protein [Streptobacillus moniliformis]SQA12855.1 LIV-II [Streptobacillus moniliformis]
MKIKKEYMYVSLLIFGMFFGAGNLIFPPFVGKEAGSAVVISMIGFGITSTVTTMLGVYLGFKENILGEIYSKLGMKFTKLIFCLACCAIAIIAIPRAALTPFTMMITEVVVLESNVEIFKIIYIILFFSMVYYLSYNQSNILTVIGKILTPLLLALIFIIAITTFTTQKLEFLFSNEMYQSLPLLKGFLQGYNTMDSLGSIIVGITVVNIIKNNYNLKEGELKTYGKVGVTIAGILMFLIYLILGVIGAGLSKNYTLATNGAIILKEIVRLLFGNFGIFVLIAVFFVACLTACISILTFSSEFNYEAFSKFKYTHWLKFFIGLSILLSMLSLDMILKLSIPILLLIYPIILSILLLEITNEKDKRVYKGTMIFLIILNTVTIINSIVFKLDIITGQLMKLPFYNDNFSWAIPTVLFYFLLKIVYGINKK